MLLTRGASFNHDGTLVAYLSNAGGRLDIWAQPVAGGSPRQLTHVKGFVETFEFSPTRDQLVFGADVGGDELTQLHLTDSKGGEPVALFPGDPEGTRADFVRWADDGKTFLYTCSRRDPKYSDLYEYDLASRRSALLWQASGKLSLGLVSRDHRRFVLVETNSDADTNLYLVKRGVTTPPQLLTPHQGEILFTPADMSPDGKTLFLTSDQSGEFQGISSIDLATKRLAPLGQPKWDVDAAGFSKGGRYYYTVVNADGVPEVALFDARTMKPVPLPAVGAPGPLVPIAFSKSDRYLAARLQTDTAPSTVWVIDLKEGRGHRLVDPLPESLKTYPFVAGRSVRVKSFDGVEVPAFLYAPGGAGPFPALISVHGGPTAQSLRDFSLFTQYLVSKGYVVLVPNVRGSTGYGKTYTRADNKDLGGAPLKDVVACKQWLVDQAHVDAARVTIMGGSYGGYMTLAAATFTPTEFAAHVDIFGVSDLKSLVESFPPYWTSAATYIYQKFGDPNDPADAKYQHDRSPLYFIDQIVRPLLVVQGTNDARVKKDQSDRVVEALRKRGVAVDYLVIEGEGHGFSKTENRQLALETTDRFLDRHIFGDTEVKVLP
jgi:dipeptidyl aminopeptidase/acylaminoacyl peptidase